MSAPHPEYLELDGLARAAGLELRGGFHPLDSDDVPALADGRQVATVVLLGNVGGSLWPAFAAAPESGDGLADPLDRFSRRLIDALAEDTGAGALYPFQGPPWLPFQRWAMRAEPVFASPIGPLVHPRYGLWHAWRGALAFATRLHLPHREAGISPCLACAAQPCLATCPVDAFVTGRYHVDACVAHVVSDAGSECAGGGCVARRACPVGVPFHYPAPQQAFHMQAFVSARRRATSR